MIGANGALELSFDDGSVLFLDSAADGQSLRCRSEKWRDPFAPPLSTVNKEYIACSGKWTGIDVSDMVPYNSVVDQVVHEVWPVWKGSLTIAGVILTTSTLAIVAISEADEMFVSLEDLHLPLGSRR